MNKLSACNHRDVLIHFLITLSFLKCWSRPITKYTIKVLYYLFGEKLQIQIHSFNLLLVQTNQIPKTFYPPLTFFVNRLAMPSRAPIPFKKLTFKMNFCRFCHFFWYLGQTDHNNRSFDYNKRIICTVNYPKGPGTWQFDHNNRMITLSVITLSGFHCIMFLYCYLV